MTADILVALLGGREIGQIQNHRRGRLTFIYHEDWRSFRGAYPLSLSMPLAAAEHGHDRIEPFLWNLLPDNALILDRWARRFRVSARNAFALIAQVGEDCAGAVQFARPERLDALRTPREPEVEWLDESGVAARLRALRADLAAWRNPGDTGQFSLAGAQAKTALLYDNGRWGVPGGRMPTTHILKPPIAEFDGHAENEHLCLALARELGLPAAGSEVRRFEDEVAIVIERYDRASTSEMATPLAAGAAAKAAEAAMWAAATDDPSAADRAATAAAEAAATAARAQALRELAKSQPILRLHQEDLCQAFGVPPTSKYQNEGGPTPQAIVQLLQNHSSEPTEDVATFVSALAFNWLIAGTDAHAKNYALLHGGGGRVRLAPLYDLASALPSGHLDPHRLALAMKIGGEYRVRDITRRQWTRLADELRLEPGEMIAQVAALAATLPAAIISVRDRATQAGLSHPIIDRLAGLLTHRAEDCLRTLQA